MLWAELHGQDDEWKKLGTELDAQHGFLEVMPAAFTLLAHRRFGKQGDLREVTRFVKAFNRAAPAADRIESRAAEAVVRGFLGEGHLLEVVDREQTGRIMYALLFALVDELDLDDPELHNALREAEVALSQLGRQAALAASAEHRSWSNATALPTGRMRWRPGKPLTSGRVANRKRRPPLGER
jgi:hypothetical protein